VCECRKKFDESLAQNNGKLAAAFHITEDMGLEMRYVVATEKIDKAKRKPVPTVVANYCPFCGERFKKEGE
jgi:hypothetical protein